MSKSLCVCVCVCVCVGKRGEGPQILILEDYFTFSSIWDYKSFQTVRNRAFSSSCIRTGTD